MGQSNAAKGRAFMSVEYTLEHHQVKPRPRSPSPIVNPINQLRHSSHRPNSVKMQNQKREEHGSLWLWKRHRLLFEHPPLFVIHGVLTVEKECKNILFYFLFFLLNAYVSWCPQEWPERVLPPQSNPFPYTSKILLPFGPCELFINLINYFFITIKFIN